jgi:hypothetical protein
MEDVLIKVKKEWKSFSQEDDRIIEQQVGLYPTNISHALQEAGNLINKSFKAVSGHYYYKMRKDPKVKAVTCGSKKGFTQNVKNLKRDIDGNMPEQDLKGYMWVMKEMLDLPREERELIVSFLTGIPAGRTKKLFN